MRYPMARWELWETSMGAGVHTRRVPEGEGGGYYRYEWGYGDSHIVLVELVQGTTKAQRENGVRARYAELDRIKVDPDAVRDKARGDTQEVVARMIFADMKERFARIAEWIPYDSFGKRVWFHDRVTRGRASGGS
jgi:hypothetical protein